jgi:hypothetical protein
MVNEIVNVANENCETTFYYDIIKDFVFPLLLTLISGVVAWFLFIKQILNDKKKENQSKNDEVTNKLTYFAMIIHNAIENSIGQNINIKELSIEIEKSGFNSIPLNKYPTYDLKIVAEKLDKESYLLSYLKYYKKDNKIEMLEDFKKIVDTCGIINDIFNQIDSDLENKQKFEHDLMKKFYEGSDKCADYFGESLVKLKESNNPLFFKLFEINKASENLKNFTENQIIKAQYELFLKPTLILLNKCHSEHVEFDENLGDLWVQASNTINIYNNLESETFRLNEMLKEANSFINELIEVLKKSSDRLRKDFLN